MTTQELLDILTPAVDKFGGFPKPVKFIIDGEQIFHIHNKDIVTRDQPADCTISMSLQILQQIIAGETDPMSAVMEGDIEVAGDSAIAISVQGLF